MPDQFSPEFNPEILQKDIERISEEVQRYRELPESKGLSEKEILRKALQTTVVQSDDEKSKANDDGFLPSYAGSAPAGTKLEIESLLSMAFSKGILEATKEAAKSSPFVLDAFHDALLGKLYPEFQKRGLLK